MERLNDLLQLLPVNLHPSNAELHHECNVIAQLQAGDHIAVPIGTPSPERSSTRVPWHHGIYLGESKVMHMTGNSKEDACIQQEGIEHFLNSGGYKYVAIIQYPAAAAAAASRDATVRLARELQSAPQRAYDLLDYNCESFATFCRTGRCGGHAAVSQHLKSLPLKNDLPTKSCFLV